MLSTEAVEEFKKLYEKEYKVRLKSKEALELGTRLINMVKAVYGSDLPEPKNIDKEAKKGNN